MGAAPLKQWPEVGFLNPRARLRPLRQARRFAQNSARASLPHLRNPDSTRASRGRGPRCHYDESTPLRRTTHGRTTAPLRVSKVHGSYPNRADGRVAHRRGASPRQGAIREEGGGAQFKSDAPSPFRCPPGSRSRRATCTPATRTTRRPAAGRRHRPRPRIWPRGRRCRASRGGSA